nr:LOW QUALITY PROTEIN: uncharacterized protein LOC119181213 [Rhipicephalus microplus]
MLDRMAASSIYATVAADVPLVTVHPTPKPPADILDVQAQPSECEIHQGFGTSAFSNHQDVNNEDGLEEAVVDYLTVHFKEYPNVRAVLDCPEIPLQRQKNLESQLLTYSWYKGTYTAKVLVCETPGGHISFLSKAYGGRASDSFITKESKILEKFLPSIDSVMVDKGFLIDELSLQHHVTMVSPPFLRKKKQLTQREAQQNQSIAAARVHGERAIQRMKVFKVLSRSLGTELFPYIYDILTVIAGIVNLSKPIFSAEKFLYE